MSVISKAERHVDQHATKEWKKAYARLLKEQHGQGCGCSTCKHLAVDEVNSWTDWISFGDESVPRYEIDIDGEIDLR